MSSSDDVESRSGVRAKVDAQAIRWAIVKVFRNLPPSPYSSRSGWSRRDSHFNCTGLCSPKVNLAPCKIEERRLHVERESPIRQEQCAASRRLITPVSPKPRGTPALSRRDNLRQCFRRQYSKGNETFERRDGWRESRATSSLPCRFPRDEHRHVEERSCAPFEGGAYRRAGMLKPGINSTRQAVPVAPPLPPCVRAASERRPGRFRHAQERSMAPPPATGRFTGGRRSAARIGAPCNHAGRRCFLANSLFPHPSSPALTHPQSLSLR